MAFNADEYISVIVEQIGENFSSLDDTVKNCPDLKDANIYMYKHKIIIQELRTNY